MTTAPEVDSPVQRRKSILVVGVKEGTEEEKEVSFCEGSPLLHVISPATDPNRLGQFGGVLPRVEGQQDTYCPGDHVMFTTRGTCTRGEGCSILTGVVVRQHVAEGYFVIEGSQGCEEVVPWYRIKATPSKVWWPLALQALSLGLIIAMLHGCMVKETNLKDKEPPAFAVVSLDGQPLFLHSPPPVTIGIILCITLATVVYYRNLKHTAPPEGDLLV